MRLILTALGSYGDVYPMVGLGAMMRSRGHQVTVITNPHFQSAVESVGLELLPLGTVQEYDELTRHPDLWDPIRGPMMILQLAMKEQLRTLYELIETAYVPGETVLGAHALDLASRNFQERHGTPLASIHFAPVGLRSFVESPQMFFMLMTNRTPVWLRRLQYWLADRLVIDRLLGPSLNAFRAELDLPPVSRVLQRWYFSPQLVLGLFPDWFASPQPDWPDRTSLTGFPLWDHATDSQKIGSQLLDAQLPDEVTEFLSGGEPPIVFAPGSAMTQGELFFSAAVEACQQLGRRAILLTKYPDQLPRELPPTVCHFDFVPFSQLLPRAAAVVHHGGIGSCAQSLAAGIPQLVKPMAYDQLDNAQRLRRLGVGQMLRPRHFQGAKVALALDRLLSAPATHEQCHRYAQKCDGQAALTTAAEHLERLETERSEKSG